MSEVPLKSERRVEGEVVNVHEIKLDFDRLES